LAFIRQQAHFILRNQVKGAFRGNPGANTSMRHKYNNTRWSSGGTGPWFTKNWLQNPFFIICGIRHYLWNPTVTEKLSRKPVTVIPGEERMPGTDMRTLSQTVKI